MTSAALVVAGSRCGVAEFRGGGGGAAERQDFIFRSQDSATAM